MRKPDISTFEWVIKDANISARETLFIEDSIQHIENAQKVGIQTHLWKSTNRLRAFFLTKLYKYPVSRFRMNKENFLLSAPSLASIVY